MKVYAESRRIKCFFAGIYYLLMRGISFYKTKKKLGCLFLQPRIFFKDAGFRMKVYIGGRRLCGAETESIVAKFYLERVVQRKSLTRRISQCRGPGGQNF